MMKQSKGLRGMYSWFCKEPTRLRSLSAIDQRCLNLDGSATTNDLNGSRSRYFLPLLRCGVIEFYGAGLFGLSPTCALRSGQRLLIINGPDKLLSELGAHPDSAFPGVSRSGHGPMQIGLLRRLRIPHYQFSLQLFWQKLPQPSAVVKQWPTTIIEDLRGFEYFDEQWKPLRGYDEPGIYRRSSNAYAERYYRTKNGDWHILPNLLDNIDAFNQAVLADKAQRANKLNIIYSDRTASLKIGLRQFPVIAERLMLLHTLMEPVIADPLERNYAFPNHMLKHLQYYTSNLIHYAE